MMGFTGHRRRILLFTRFSLAKCKQFPHPPHPQLERGKVKQGHLQPSDTQARRALAAAFVSAAILICNCAHGNLGEMQKLDS